MIMKTNKWQTLTHLGPVFPPLYQYQKYEIKVQGKTVILSKEAEEVAVFWAQKHATDYVKDPVFQKNFWRDFKPFLSKELKTTSFPKDWDFINIIRDLEYKKEVKKNRSKEIKKKEKEEAAARKEKFGFATLDGKRIALGNYTIEPPGLFMGRGKHPLRGSLKVRTFPEDITINCSGSGPKPPEGHSWKEVVENKNALMVASWKQELTGEYKKVLFSNDSIVKQKSDQSKFNKAIKLAKNLDFINAEIDKKLNDKLSQTRKVATVAKLISQLAIRVGDEKSEDTADTFGATSLLSEHIKIDEVEGTIEFDFLGKDSIRYNKVVSFSPSMIRNFVWLCKGKKPSAQLFPGITSKDVNEFLSSIVEGVTAKVFRTAYGSKLLAEELSKGNLKGMTVGQKMKFFTDANLEVAIKLNHQTAVSPAYKISLKNMKDKLKNMKIELRDKKAEASIEIEKAKKIKDERVKLAKKKYTGVKQKDSIRRAKATFKKKKTTWEARVERLKMRVENLETKIDIKKKTSGIATGTSKTNYISPRIIYSFCKANDIEVKRVFTPTLQKKFKWAEDTDKDYYKQYPNVDY